MLQYAARSAALECGGLTPLCLVAMSNVAHKQIVKEIEINASPDAVWKALTDAEELSRWFPLEARVTPGPGGKIFLSWGPNCEGEGQITAWQPGARFAWSENNLLLVEWTIEARGGKTVLRLVNSGFGELRGWDDEYYGSVEYGWGFMLANLRLYLERHAGRPRLVAWPRRIVDLPRQQAWDGVMGDAGIPGLSALASLAKGAEFALGLNGETLSGTVLFMSPPRGFCLRVANMNDALLWLSIERPGGKSEVGFWLSAYDVPAPRVEEFERRWLAALEKVFPA